MATKGKEEEEKKENHISNLISHFSNLTKKIQKKKKNSETWKKFRNFSNNDTSRRDTLKRERERLAGNSKLSNDQMGSEARGECERMFICMRKEEGEGGLARIRR